jgi:RNA polymerase sigma-70 factor (ECF subfamily)
MTPPAPTALDSELERLLAAFRGRLRAIIQQRCPARLGLDADDVEQEIRIRLWKALASERVIDHPASYLHRVALSVIVDLLRRRSARPDLDRAEALDEIQLGSQADPNTFDPLRHAEGAAAGQAVLRALASLPERRRRPVQLHLQGFSTTQVGQLLGISEAAARNLVYRGLDELRERLTQEGWNDE